MTVKNTLLVFVALAVAISACTPTSTDTTSTSETDADSSTTTATSPSPSAKGTPAGLDAFIADISAELLRRSPEDVTDLGLGEFLNQRDDELNDLSIEFRSETAAIATDALAKLDTFPTETLDGDDALTVAVLRWYLRDIVTLSRFPEHDYAVNYITGAHANFPEFMADVHEIKDAADADAYIARLEAAGTQMRQVADNLERSKRSGVIPTVTGLQIAAWQINNVLGAPGVHPLVADLTQRLSEIDGVTREEITEYAVRAGAAVESFVQPGYGNLLEAVDGIDGRPDTAPGVGLLPGGDDYYPAVLQHHLSIDLSPAETHEIGLANVERLISEITVALSELGYDVAERGFASAISEARADGGVFTLDTETAKADVLDLATRSVEEAQSAFTPMFSAFPQADLLVVRPRAGRESGSGAYYRPPPAVGTRPGLYYLSLGGPTLDIQTFQTTNFHETVPGHHFQIALQRESGELPLIQRATTFTGYAEGWALYAELLAFEAGLYEDDPQGNLGRLRMELLRAARAVVDTGIHDLGWSKDRAVGYMTDLGFSEPQASGEVDRYVVWPGQAPSYLIGMLEILRLRDEARDALGADFDIASFHDEILRHGSLPLSVLDDVIADFIAANR